MQGGLSGIGRRRGDGGGCLVLIEMLVGMKRGEAVASPQWCLARFSFFVTFFVTKKLKFSTIVLLQDQDRTVLFGTVLFTLPILPDHCAHQNRADMDFLHSRFSRSAVIRRSASSAAVRSAAVTEIYAFSFGSVPDGRMTTEPEEVKYFSTSEAGRPFKPTE